MPPRRGILTGALHGCTQGGLTLTLRRAPYAANVVRMMPILNEGVSYDGEDGDDGRE